jgi:hypothetical protein
MWHEWETGEVHKGFWWGDLREREYLEELGVDGKIIEKGIFTNWNRGMGWIGLIQDRDKWHALLNVVMNFRVP